MFKIHGSKNRLQWRKHCVFGVSIFCNVCPLEEQKGSIFIPHTSHFEALFKELTLKHLPAMWETWVQSLGWVDSLEEEMATHSSILAWRIPWTEEPGGLQSMGSQRIRHDWATSLSLSLGHFHYVFGLLWLLVLVAQCCSTLWHPID